MEGLLTALRDELAALGPGNSIGLVGVTVGVITAIKGLIEYDRSQRWKRGEFLASEMTKWATVIQSAGITPD